MAIWIFIIMAAVVVFLAYNAGKHESTGPCYYCGMMTMFSAGYFIGVVIGFIIFGGVLYMCHQEDRRRERKARK
ncbi:hypothetical protein IANJMKHF_00273 [Klebsiella phage CPRSA]|nr:hypothetical protein IANJMKHF_00273 [Klebsiella phage CPRSA]UQJ95616.1 hypothetical protein ALHIDCOG_00228 [Klebsiella phage CPRSB]